MERICDHSVHDRKGAQHHEVQDREQGSGKHIPEALSEFDKSFHAAKEGGEAWWSGVRGRGSEEAILVLRTRGSLEGGGLGLGPERGQPLDWANQYIGAQTT